MTSGVRIGTPAVTSRGLRKAEMVQLAGWIRGAFEAINDETKLARLKGEVLALAQRFPLYPEWG